MLSGIEDAPWQPLSLCVLMHEMPSVSRMREIRTSGLRRGEGLTKTVLLYSAGLALNSFRISCNRLVFCFVKEDYLHGFEGDVGLAILIKISCNDGVMTSKCDTRRWDARVCMMN